MKQGLRHRRTLGKEAAVGKGEFKDLFVRILVRPEPDLGVSVAGGALIT